MSGRHGRARPIAATFGWTAEEVLGRNTGDHEATVAVHESRVLEGDFKLRRKHGSALWTHFTGVCLFDERGEHVANMALHTDITARKCPE